MDTQWKLNKSILRTGRTAPAELQRSCAALLMTILALTAISCGGQGDTPQLEAPHGQPAAPAQPAVPAGSPLGLSLPAVESLRSLSVVQAGRGVSGDENVPSLTSSDAVVSMGRNLELNPNWDGQQNLQASYAGYLLDMSGYAGPAVLRVDHWQDAAGSKQCYAGLANWETGTWNWLDCPDETEIQLPSLAPYVRVADNALVVVVLFTGDANVGIYSVRAGSDLAPVMNAVPSVSTGSAPLTVSFDTSGCYDLDSEAALEFDFLGNGNFVEYVDEFTYISEGTFQVKARIDDGVNPPVELTIPITINGIRPVAMLTADLYIGQPGQMINFDGTLSQDSDGGINSYGWDLDGDGSDESGGPGVTVASQQYNTVGTYHATLTVTDNEGFKDSEYVTIVIGAPYHETEPNDNFQTTDELPTAPFQNFLGDIGPAAMGGAGNEEFLLLRVLRPGQYTLNLQWLDSTMNLDLEVTSTLQFIGSGSSASFEEILGVALVPGDYFVKIKNRSDTKTTDWALSMTTAFTELPVALLTISPDSGAQPLPAILNASASYDPDGSIATYEWDPYGDGDFEFSTGNVSSLNFTYRRQGNFYPRVRVTDDDGAVVVSDYFFVNTTGAPLDEVEPNDQVASAQVVNLPLAAFTGDIGQGGWLNSQGGGTDYYRVTLPGTGMLHVELECESVSCEPVCWLYYVDGANGVWKASATGMGDVRTMDYALTQPGDYLIYIGTSRGSSEYKLSAAVN